MPDIDEIFEDFFRYKRNREITPKEPPGYRDAYETEQQKIRDRIFSKLLNIYVLEVHDKTRANKKYRGMIFWATFVAMCFTIVLAMAKSFTAYSAAGKT